MNKFIKKLFTTALIVLIMSITASIAKAQSKISFEVSFTEPQAHYADVKMQIDGFKKDYVDVKMPVWAPGSYLIREFAKNVEAFAATDLDGKPLQASKISKNTWRVNLNAKNAIINYRVYAFEISVRTSFIDVSHAFLSPTGIFMYVDGLIQHPATVTINPYKNWKTISTGLEAVKNKSNTFVAADFDILFDSPIEVGNQDVFSFNANGVHHEVAMYGKGNYNVERIKTDLTKIVNQETAIFGENPNNKYVFIIHNYNTGSGGLEHLNSTVLGVTRANYNTEAGYQSFLGLVAHEYFHLWNVKRLRPRALGPFNYDQENYTTNLWIAEGFTAYYQNQISRRTNMFSPEKYADVVCTEIATVENQPGNKYQSAAEASFDAWIKYYRPTENSKNSTISYYNKGSLIGMIMDLEILHVTNAQMSLDDVMKAAYEEFYKKQHRGYTDQEFKNIAEKIAGISFDKFYNNYVNGTIAIDYNTYFGYAGLKLVNDNANKKDAYIGVATEIKEGKTIITNVSRGSAAWEGGLNVNDEIIAVDGVRLLPLSATELDKIISFKNAGEQIAVTVFRDAQLKAIEITLKKSPNVNYHLEPLPTVNNDQMAVRKKWLKL